MNLRERIITAFGALNETSAGKLDELRELYADDVHFQDPIQTVRGLDAFIEMNRSLISKVRELSFEVTASAGSDEEMFLAWTMTFAPKHGPRVEVDGTSHVRTEHGKVVYHRDYWDIAGMFAGAIPGGRRLLSAILKPFV